MGLVFSSEMLNRMLRAAMLDKQLYNEVEADTSLDQEALSVVVWIALVAGILGFFGSILFGQAIVSAIIGLVYGIIWTVVGYFIYAYLAYFIGVNLFQGKADFGELKRTLGYSYTPMIFSVIPCLGAIVGGIWTFIAGIVAVREALDVDTTKAVLTVLISIVIMMVIGAIIGSIFGISAFAVGSLGH